MTRIEASSVTITPPQATSSRGKQQKSEVKSTRFKIDTSDNESDAGASPSVSESETSSVSSRCSSPTQLKIVCKPLTTPKKKSSSIQNRQPQPRKKISQPQSVQKSAQPSSTQASTSSSSTITAATPQKQNKSSTTTTTNTQPRKRKQQQRQDPSSKLSKKSTPTSTQTKKNNNRTLNQRRRTKSERNSRAGKVPDALVADVVEESLALDTEIDKFLEEKAIENNLTATNVKSIIRHVITNNMVQKLIMSTVRKKNGNPDDSSDDEAFFEPKLTRARTKLLLGSSTHAPTPLWPLASPAKPTTSVSETHVLIQDELPEDSSGDEEYVPKVEEDEFHSDDESSSVCSASHASDAGSPRVSTPGSASSSSRKRRDVRTVSELLTPCKDNLFKTPPPIKPKCARRLLDSAIGQRTRSKLPLNDTPLEDLEMQLIPPDITMDMYDWGKSDNEDYLAFVKEFLCPGQNGIFNNEAGDDEEADPEYNVMEDEEEHDKEELRMDRAVKVSKKELNELVAELLEESHFTSGDELDQTDFTSYCQSQLSHMSMSNIQEPAASNQQPVDAAGGAVQIENNSTLAVNVPPSGSATPSSSSAIPPENNLLKQKTITSSLPLGCSTLKSTENISTICEKTLVDLDLQQEKPVPTQQQPESWFNETSIATLEHQIRQHIQLLATSYVLTAGIEDPYYKDIANSSKQMITEMRDLNSLRGGTSVISKAPNVQPAWELVTSWPQKPCNNSPKKKKILEEKYMNEFIDDWADESLHKLSTKSYFPRRVVQVIAESAAFIYPELLPVIYNQRSRTKCYFFQSEDILLTYALEELKLHSMSLKEKAKVISQYCLPVRNPEAVFHRVRNLKKARSSCPKVVKEYYVKGTLPPVPVTPPWDARTAVAPNRQPIENLSLFWRSLLTRLMVGPDKRKLEDVKVVKKRGPPSKKNKQEIEEAPIKGEAEEMCLTALPFGTTVIQNQLRDHPELMTVPLLNSNGDPGAFMFIPKYALAAPGNSSSPKGTETIQEIRMVQQALPFSPPQVIEKISTTPKKQCQDVVTVSFTPVGKPFILPGVENDFLTLSSLDTPLKKAIMEHVEQNDSVVVPQKVVVDRTEQSARTFGNYVRGSVNNNTNQAENVSDSSSEDEDRRNALLADDDVNLTEYEENMCDETDDQSSLASPRRTIAVEVITLETDVEDDVILKKKKKSPKTLGREVNDAGDCKDNNNTSKEKEHSTIENSHANQKTKVDSQKPTKAVMSLEDKDDDDDGDKEKRNQLKRKTPDDASDEVDKYEDTEEEPEEPKKIIKSPKKKPLNSSLKSIKGRGIKNNTKKHKMGSSTISQPKKRISKCIPIEKMLEEDNELDEEVCDAFMQAFLSKIQSITEPRHPGLHNEFVKLLDDCGKNNDSQSEILSKVRVLLKDFPELFAEFSTYVDSQDESVPVDDQNFSEFQEMQAQLNFIRHLEKFTEKIPQLKAKIMHKFKVLKDEPNMCEKDVAESLAPFFQSNPIIMDAFQALYPSVYRPALISSTNSRDFEEIDMEAETPLSQEDSNVEVIKLPEEKAVPATNTCPCQCHNTTTHVYSSRVKHCHKCCIKFQDGKVFVHNGRVVRPVNVELTSPSAARNILSGSSCRNCVQESNPKTKESPTSSSSKLKKESAETAAISSKTSKPEVEATVVECVKLVPPPQPIVETETLEEGEISELEDENNPPEEPPPSSTSSDKIVATSSNSRSLPGETIVTLKPWTIEEDRIILTHCQSEPSIEDAFEKLTSILPQRDITEIESRCVELISLLQQTMNQETAIE